MHPFFYIMLLSSLSQVMTAGRVMDSVPFSRDRSDKEIQAMIANAWIPRDYKFGLLKAIAFDLQEYSEDRWVQDRTFDPRLKVFETGCRLLEATEKERGISEEELVELKAARAKMVNERKRHMRAWWHEHFYGAKPPAPAPKVELMVTDGDEERCCGEPPPPTPQEEREFNRSQHEVLKAALETWIQEFRGAIRNPVIPDSEIRMIIQRISLERRLEIPVEWKELSMSEADMLKMLQERHALRKK